MSAHRAAADEHSVGFALMILGAATARTADHHQGTQLLQEALATARSSNDAWLEMQTLNYLGMVMTSTGEFTAARHCLEEGLRGAREVGDSRSVGAILTNPGRNALAADNPTTAASWFQQALTVQRQLGDIWALTSMQGLAATYLTAGATAPATGLINESLTVAWNAHDRPGIAAALTLLARVAGREGEPVRACRLYGAASVLSPLLSKRPTSDLTDTVDLATTRAALDPDQFAEHWARGRAMILDDAVGYALKQHS